LVWPWNCGSRMKSDSSSADGAGHHVVGGDDGGALAVADQLAIGLQARVSARAARLVRAALRRRARCCNRTGRSRPRILRPGDRPFDAAALGEARPRRRRASASRRRARRSRSARKSARPPGKCSTSSAGHVSSAAGGRSSSGSRRRGTDRPWTAPCGRAAPGLKCASSPKISGSGWKLTVVPRRFGTAPTFQLAERLAARKPGARAAVARDLDFSRRTAR
jgi:hypothetical protein